MRLPFELVEVLVSGQERILNRILRVGCIAQVPICLSVKRGQAARKNVVHFAIFLFADTDVEARFVSDGCLCRLHVGLCLLVRQEKGTPLSNQLPSELTAYFQQVDSNGRTLSTSGKSRTLDTTSAFRQKADFNRAQYLQNSQRDTHIKL